jgi:CD109 antigen
MLTYHFSGDIFGASFENLDKLLRMPYGCGEQNMLYFAPSIQAALYMNVTNRIDDAKREKIRNILKTGKMIFLFIICFDQW